MSSLFDHSKLFEYVKQLIVRAEWDGTSKDCQRYQRKKV